MTEKSRNKWTKPLAIASISLLTGFALYMGHNGVLLMTSIGLISGISGYELKESSLHPLNNTDSIEKSKDN